MRGLKIVILLLAISAKSFAQQLKLLVIALLHLEFQVLMLATNENLKGPQKHCILKVTKHV